MVDSSEQPVERGHIKYKSYKNNFFKKIKISSREVSEDMDEVRIGEMSSSYAKQNVDDTPEKKYKRDQLPGLTQKDLE